MCKKFKKELTEWWALKDEIAALKEKEDKMRRKLFGEYFPDPKIGVNTIKFVNDYQLKGVPRMNVNVDMAMLGSVGRKLGDKIMDKIIRWKPEPVNKEVKLLTDKQRKTFEQALIMKPGIPDLRLIEPKES